MSAPVITVPNAQFVLNGQAINFTPSATGSGITWTFANLPVGASGNASTGAITGTLSTNSHSYTKITATNVDGSDSVYVPIAVYASLVSISHLDTFPFSLSGTDKLYRLSEDITVNGTLFAITGTRSSLDLNGKIATFDNGRDQTIVNGGFETGDLTGWNVAGAPGAAIIAGSYLGKTLAEGTYGLHLSVPVGQTQSIQTSASYTLTANREYGVTMWMNKPTATISMAFSGTLLSKASFTTNKIGTVGEWVFISTTTVSGPLVITVQNTGTVTQDVYFDRIRLDESRKHGVACPYGDFTPTVVGQTHGTDFLIANGTVIQGAGANYNCAPLFYRSADNLIAHKVALETHVDATNGNYGNPINIANGNNLNVSHCTITNRVRWIRHREQYNGASIYGAGAQGRRVYFRNTFDRSPQSGIYSSTSAGTLPLIIDGNIFKLTSKYTNGFCVNIRDQDMDIPGNQIINNRADYTADIFYGSRGFHINNGRNYQFSGNHMVLTEQANNQEYGGKVLGGGYGIQFETQPSNGFLDVNNDYYEIFGNVDGGALRLLAEPTANVNTITNSTFVVNTNGSAFTCGCLRIELTDLSKFIIQNCTFITDSALISVDGGSNTNTLVMEDCTFTHIDHGSACHPFEIDFNANLIVELRNPSYGDAGSRTWIKQAGRANGGGVQSLAASVTHDCEITFLNGVTPQAALQVDIQSNLLDAAFSGQANGSGKVITRLTEFTADLTALFDNTPFEITTGHPSYHTYDLDDTNETITFDVITNDEGPFGSTDPILFGSAGTFAAGSNSITLPYAASIQAGNLLVAFFVNKQGTRLPADIPGWTRRVDLRGGPGANGTADQGEVRTTVFTKEADGTETGSLVVPIPSGSSTCARIFRYSKATDKVWAIAFTTGAKLTPNTDYTVVGSALIDIAADDIVLVCHGINTDAYTYSSHTLSVPGITSLDTPAVRNAQGTSVGVDSYLSVIEHIVLGGTSTGVPTASMLASGTDVGNPGGTSIFLRLRQEGTVVVPVINSPANGATILINENTQVVTSFNVTATPTASPTLSGADAALFTMVGTSLRFITAPVYATPHDANTDNNYQVTVTYTNVGGADSAALTVSVLNVNENPTDINLSTSVIPSGFNTTGGYTVGQLSTVDADLGDTFTYSIIGGIDATFFTINGTNLIIDVGIPDRTTYVVRVQSEDNNGGTFDKLFTITTELPANTVRGGVRSITISIKIGLE